MAIHWLDSAADSPFPAVDNATSHGLLAAGGDLSVTRLLNAYQQGIFPWFNAQDPILWWSPDPRMVFQTQHFHISKSLKKALGKKPFEISLDRDFKGVMQACAAPRMNGSKTARHETWIHDDMIQAYSDLHQAGYAHSVECWQADRLVGGVYGVAIGKMFFGESMFSFETNASKIALLALVQQLSRWGYPLMDCQVYSDHLSRLGAVNIPRSQFVHAVQQLCSLPGHTGNWASTNISAVYES